MTKSVFAADFNVSCGASTCTPSTLTGFFPASEIWYPGKTYSRTLQITNTSGSTQKVMVAATNTSTTGSLDQVVQYTITREDSTTPWDNSLHAFYGNGETQILDALANGASHTFTFTGFMYDTAGNEYQDKTTQHDLVIGYLFTPTPTPTACTAAEPNVPGGNSISRTNDTEIKISWGAVSGTVTGYKITWSKDTDTDGDGAGSKTVGNTTETTIGGLELNKYGYYFKVRAINDCKEGGPNGIVFVGSGSDKRISPTATPTPGSAVLGASTGEGQVEGAQTNILTPTPVASVSGTVEIPAVLGTATQKCNCIWWQILLGELLVATWYFFRVVEDVKQKKQTFIGLLGVAITYGIYRWFNKCLTYNYLVFANTPSLFCKYFIVVDALIMTSIMLIAKYRQEKN
jgi:hypothetical protein